MRPRSRVLQSCKKLFAAALLLWGAPLVAQIPGLTLTPVAIPTPRTVNPYRIGPGSNGKVWFSDVQFRQVGFISANGAITAFRLIDSVDPNNEVRPLAITEGPDGNGWFTISLTNGSGSPIRTEIGRVTPTGVITRFPTPTVDACRVFGTASVCGITVGPDGNLWFTETREKRIGRITLSGQITEFLADGSGGEFFYGITAGPDGNLWVADSGDIIRITPAGVITFFSRQGLLPVGITAGPDGNVWFTDGPSNSIGRITPAGTITLFPIPSPMSIPFSIVAGSDGKLYFTEASNAAPKIGQIDPATGVIKESAVTGRGLLRDIVSLSGGSSGRIGIAQAAGDVQLAVQSTNSNPAQEELTKATISQAAGPNLSITKTGRDVVRRGDYLMFEVTVSNTGTAPDEWSVREIPGDGLENCHLSGVFGYANPVDFSIIPELSGGQNTLIITPKKPALAPGETVRLAIFCDVVGAGLKTNRVTLTTKQSGSRFAAITVKTLEMRNPLSGSESAFPALAALAFYDPDESGRR